jgi:hypothetical protein
MMLQSASVELHVEHVFLQGKELQLQKETQMHYAQEL